MDFGNITVDGDCYIVIPIILAGRHADNYEIAPYQVSPHNLDNWLHHMQEKRWWDKENNNDFIHALNFVANGTNNNSIQP